MDSFKKKTQKEKEKAAKLVKRFDTLIVASYYCYSFKL